MRWTALLLYVLLLVVLNIPFVSTPHTNALNDYIDPNGGDGTVTWNTAVPSGTHCSTIDEGTRQPTTPTTSDYISQVANSTGADNCIMSTVSSVGTVTDIQVWAYHNDGSNGLLHAGLFDSDELTQYGSTLDFTQVSSDTWNSVTFSSLTLDQTQLDDLRVRLTTTKSGGGATATVYVYAMYGYITYSAPISVTVDNGVVSYGMLDTSTSQDTTSGGVDNTQVATNESAIAVDFNIMGQNTTNWTLASSAGSEQYVHSYCTSGAGAPDPCDSTPSWTPLTTGYQTLATNIAGSGTQRFDLKLDMPTSTSNYSEQSTLVTVQVVEYVP